MVADDGFRKKDVSVCVYFFCHGTMESVGVGGAPVNHPAAADGQRSQG